MKALDIAWTRQGRRIHFVEVAARRMLCGHRPAWRARPLWPGVGSTCKNCRAAYLSAVERQKAAIIRRRKEAAP